MNIKVRDLNLLVLFHTLYEERNASRSAEKLMISQPGLSHQLNKLRHEWRDPLFIKAPRGLTPTPRAHQIAPHVAKVMLELENTYQIIQADDFLQRKETLHLYTTDYMEQKLLPQLLLSCAEYAPNVKVVTHNTQGRLPTSALESGECDLAIAGFYKDLPPSFRQQALIEEDFVVVAAKTHPVITKGYLDLEAYLQCQHVVTTLSGDLFGAIDQVLKEQGLRRHVIAGVSSFLSTAAIIRETPFIVTCLRSIAESFINHDEHLMMYDLPIQVPSVRIMQFWHERTQHDLLRSWFRQEVARALGVA